MNRLSFEERCRVLYLLCEGSSIRAITRLTGVSKDTVTKLVVDAGRACAAYQDLALRDLPCKRIQVDELWSFVYSKAKNVPLHMEGQAGDVWTWTAICADTKLHISWLVGGRDAEYALGFMHDLHSRLANRVQLTSDGHYAYLQAVDSAFGSSIDYAMLVKLYGAAPESAKGRYSPAECIGARKTRVVGDPDAKHVSTSYAERSNLITMRMHMRRFTRLTNGFSKSNENHAHAVALHMMYYNFVRVHQRLRMTPAMAAGVTDTPWGVGMIVRVIEAFEPAPAKRGPYRKTLERREAAQQISNSPLPRQPA